MPGKHPGKQPPQVLPRIRKIPLPETLLFLLLAAGCGKIFGQSTPPVFKWDRRWGGSTLDHLYSIREMDDHKIIMGGFSASPANGDKNVSNKGGIDYWVVVVDSVGNSIIWQKVYGGTSDDRLYVLEKTKSGDYIIGGSSSSGTGGDKNSYCRGLLDYWVLKINKSGTVLWQVTIGGNKNDELRSIEQTADGGFIIGGFSESDSSFDKTSKSRGGYDYWVVKLSASGSVQWNKTFGGTGDDRAYGVHQSADKGYLIAGYSSSNTGADKTQDTKGGYDFWAVRIDASGNYMWDKDFGGSDDDRLKAVDQAGDKGFLLFGDSKSNQSVDKGGPCRGDFDYWVVKTDSAGNRLWDQTYGSDQADELGGLRKTIEGNYLLAGFSKSSAGGEKSSGTEGGYDYWVFKMDSSGTRLWDVDYGGADDEYLYSVDQRCDRGLLVGGWSESGVSGDRTQDNRGVDDYWILDLDIPTIADFTFDPICNGETMNFRDLSKIYPDQWRWDFGDAGSGSSNYSDVQNPVHTYKTEGSFDVTLIAWEGCQAPDTIIKTVSVLHNPFNGKVDVGEDKEICNGESVSFNANAANVPPGAVFLWSTGETTSSISVDTPGTYVVTISSGGCDATDEVKVDYCPELSMSNAFTPNGDGLNDIFYVNGVGLHEIELYIFNRWGQQIFESHEASKGWDGTYLGSPVQEEVYVWQVRYIGLVGLVHGTVGHVAVIR